MVMSYFQQTRPDSRVESFYTTGTQKKVDRFNAEVFCQHCNKVFETMGCFYHCFRCQEAQPALTEVDIQRRTQEYQMDGMRRQYIEAKGYTVVEVCECEWWKPCKNDTSRNEDLEASLPYKRPLGRHQ